MKFETQRKMRLFCVACCRLVWDHLNEETRHAVEVAEKYADGKATLEEMYAVRDNEVVSWCAWGTCVALIDYDVANTIVSYIEVLSPKDWYLNLWDHIMYPSNWTKNVL